MLIDEPEDKRSWMMDYCKANNLSPCDEWAWEEASEAWEDEVKAQEKKDEVQT